MRIEHLAMWVRDLEVMKGFYVKYFQGIANSKYHNPNKNFQSYFIKFESGCRLELMARLDIVSSEESLLKEYFGLTHFAMSVGTKGKVGQLTDRLRSDGFQIVGEPRTTGDGYYESVVLDPEGNRIEITE